MFFEYFSPFGMLSQGKSGNPDFDSFFNFMRSKRSRMLAPYSFDAEKKSEFFFGFT
jgi:hypothetical protein